MRQSRKMLSIKKRAVNQKNQQINYQIKDELNPKDYTLQV